MNPEITSEPISKVMSEMMCEVALLLDHFRALLPFTGGPKVRAYPGYMLSGATVICQPWLTEVLFCKLDPWNNPLVYGGMVGIHLIVPDLPVGPLLATKSWLSVVTGVYKAVQKFGSSSYK